MLDGGRFLFPPGRHVSELTKKKAESIFNEYKKMGYKLAGIGVEDLSAGCQFLKDLDPAGEHLVSANLYCNGRPLFPPFRIYDVRGIKVAVVGLSGRILMPGLVENKEIEIRENDPSLDRYMAKIKKNADFIVALSSMPMGLEIGFLQRHPEIALVISSGRTYPTSLPTKQGNCLIVSSHPLGKSIGLITLFLKKEKDGYLVKRYKNRLYMLNEKTGKGCGGPKLH